MAVTQGAIEADALAFESYKSVSAHIRSTMLEKVANQLWQRSSETFKFAVEEAKRIQGETISLDASRFGENRFGYYFREPVGLVGAITPFNFPLNLVAHKVAPALAEVNASDYGLQAGGLYPRHRQGHPGGAHPQNVGGAS